MIIVHVYSEIIISREKLGLLCLCRYLAAATPQLLISCSAFKVKMEVRYLLQLIFSLIHVLFSNHRLNAFESESPGIMTCVWKRKCVNNCHPRLNRGNFNRKIVLKVFYEEYYYSCLKLNCRKIKYI